MNLFQTDRKRCTGLAQDKTASQTGEVAE